MNNDGECLGCMLLKKERDELKAALAQEKSRKEELEICLDILVNLVPQSYLDEASEERASR